MKDLEAWRTADGGRRPNAAVPGVLSRIGVVEQSTAGVCRVRLDAAACAGCSGRCGAGFRSPRIVIDLAGNASVGARVEVRASGAAFARASGVVFGLPLGMLVGGMLAVAAFDLSEAWAIGALVVGLTLTAGLARRSPAPSATMLRQL